MAVYGVPADLDLSFLVGQQLSCVSIGEFVVIFSFHREGSISVSGAWEAIDPQGKVFDRSMENGERTEYRLHRLLGQDVVGFRIDAPRSIELDLSGGYRLRVIDDLEHYESFIIEPLGVVV